MKWEEKRWEEYMKVRKIKLKSNLKSEFKLKDMKWKKKKRRWKNILCTGQFVEDVEEDSLQKSPQSSFRHSHQKP